MLQFSAIGLTPPAKFCRPFGPALWDFYLTQPSDRPRLGRRSFRQAVGARVEAATAAAGLAGTADLNGCSSATAATALILSLRYKKLQMTGAPLVVRKPAEK